VTLRIWHLALLIAMVGGIASLTVSDDALRDWQRAQELQIGNEALNRSIHKALDRPFDGYIVSTYFEICRHRSVFRRFGSAIDRGHPGPNLLRCSGAFSADRLARLLDHPSVAIVIARPGEIEQAITIAAFSERFHVIDNVDGFLIAVPEVR
jgi:hypothetical protein